MKKTSLRINRGLSGEMLMFLLLFTGLTAYIVPLQAQTTKYSVPVIKKASDFANTVYIDPSYTGQELGTIDKPYNTLSGIAIVPNTAYLLKAGTKLVQSVNKVFNNNYLGRYGEGPKPIIEGHFTVGGTHITIDGIQVQRSGGVDYAEVFTINRSNCSDLTVANCIIRGIDNGSDYPYYGVKGGGNNITFYHNEIAHTRNDGMFLHTGERYILVSNYLHHNNLGGLNSNKSTGDAIQFEWDGYHYTYIANNYIDRSHTIWKFGLIFNGTVDGTHDVVCEWNTILGPRPGNGGAAVRWLGGKNNKFNKNLVYANSGVALMESFNGHANQEAPYGVRDNHYVGAAGFYSFTPLASNLKFTTESDYELYLTSNGIKRYGSDIDPENFWNTPAPIDNCLPINISGITGNDTNNRKVGYVQTTVSGGDGIKTYAWDNGKTTKDISNLTAGIYTLTVTDESACTGSKSFAVTNMDTSTIRIIGERINIKSGYTNFEDGANVIGNILDNNLATRWSSNLSPAVVVVVLPKMYTINNIKMAFYKGNERNTFYKIYTSVDSLSWQLVADTESSGETLELEDIAPQASVGKYIKIEGFGNNYPSAEEWTSLTEFEAWGTEYKPSPTLKNNAPVASFSATSNEVLSGTVAMIDATESYDPDGDSLHFKWIVPEGICAKATDQCQLEFLAHDVAQNKNINIVLEVSDGELISTKSVAYTIKPFKLAISEAVIADVVNTSSFITPNYPKNIIDKDPTTFWSANGDYEWVTVELENPYQLSHFQVSFGNGEQSSAIFEILASTDNIAWDVIAENVSSCGFSKQFQSIDVPAEVVDKAYTYIKLAGKGSDVDKLNNFTEFRVFGTVQIASGMAQENTSQAVAEIYPVPATTYLNISTLNLPNDVYVVRLVDISGKTVYTTTKAMGADLLTRVDFGMLNKGLYFVEIGNDRNHIKITKRIAIQ
jgi:hypothetical protein